MRAGELQDWYEVPQAKPKGTGSGAITKVLARDDVGDGAVNGATTLACYFALPA